MPQDFKRQAVLIRAVAVLGSFLIVSSIIVAKLAGQRILDWQTEANAHRWADYIVENVDWMRVLSGSPITARELMVLEKGRQVGQIFDYNVYDAQWNPIVSSQQPEERTQAGGGLPSLAPAVLDAIAGGDFHIAIRSGNSPSRPQHFSEIYIPLIHAGSLEGVVQIRVDQRPQADPLARTIAIATGAIAAAITLAIGLPLLVMWRHLAERCRSEERMWKLAHFDPLTALPNRAHFCESLRHALSDADHGHGKVGVLCLDLDRFKEVNDGLGHFIGDGLLTSVGQRLVESLRWGENVGRLGGDEFAIYQTGIEQPQGVQHLAGRIGRILGQVHHIGGHEILSSASIGFAVYPDDGGSEVEILKHADLALYNAKAHGRNQSSRFTFGMKRRVRKRLQLERELRTAYASGQFEIHYQPQVDLHSNNLEGFEALVRWRHPKRGLVLPGEFISVAEETGLIRPLGNWILRQACAEAAMWSKPLRLSVNLSPAQFKQGELIQLVGRALADAQLDPARLELEITESLLIQNVSDVKQTLLDLKNLGVGITMDDFGTGYSSLSYLWQLPIDKLKIDKSFVQSFETADNVANIIQTIARLGRCLGLTIVAEGIETERQASFLCRQGYHLGQGYYYGKPAAASSVSQLLNRRYANGTDEPRPCRTDNAATRIAQHGQPFKLLAEA